MQHIHIVESGISMTNQDLNALFALHGNQRLIAGRLPGLGSGGIAEGEIEHESFPSNTGIATMMLLTCSGVFYVYSKGGVVCDVVGFHSPSGLLNIKHGKRKGGFLGTPSEEAKHYGIHGFTDTHVVIANGPLTLNRASPERDTREYLVWYLTDRLKDLLSKLVEIPDEKIFIYDYCQGDFGISAQGYFGETGRAAASVAISAGQQKNKRRCFITTATCETLRLGDDAPALQTLRWYRDQVLMQSEEGRAAVDRYYAQAPLIVAEIERSPDRAQIYGEIYRTAICPAVTAIQDANYDDAYKIYHDEVLALKKRFLNEAPPK